MPFNDARSQSVSKHPFKNGNGERGVNFGSNFCDIIYGWSIIGSRVLTTFHKGEPKSKNSCKYLFGKQKQNVNKQKMLLM